MVRALALCLLVAGCTPPPQADPEFSDATRFLFRSIEAEEPAELAFALRALRDGVTSELDLDSTDSADRALVPERLEAADAADITTPAGTDIEVGLAITVAARSAYLPDDHTEIQLLADQTPVEPNSPNQYDRVFLDGADCWATRACDWLRTDNEILRENLILELPYGLRKDLRWVDVALPDPSTVPEGQPVVNEGAPSWALVARSWTEEVAVGVEGENTLFGQYSVDVWIPFDGGTLRTLSLWWHLEGPALADETQELTARNGIASIFRRGDEYLDENAR